MVKWKERESKSCEHKEASCDSCIIIYVKIYINMKILFTNSQRHLLQSKDKDKVESDFFDNRHSLEFAKAYDNKQLQHIAPCKCGSVHC